MRTAILINVGDELLRGSIINSNLHSIARLLFQKGICLLKNIVLPDDKDAIKEELMNCLGKQDLIIITGGLGPTPDDLTRQAVAEALGKPIFYMDNVYNALLPQFKKFQIPETPLLKNYALVVEGAEIIFNDIGIAPGQVLKEENYVILLLPGPESEALHILNKYLENIETPRRHYSIIRTHTLKENEILDLIEPELKDLSFGIYPGIRGVDIFISHEDPDTLSKKIHIVKEKLNGYMYAENSKNIEEIVGEKLKQKKYTISIAESCTGGLLGNLITDVSGSSEYFLGGVVTYSNEAKIKFLMVPKEILKMYGAVSKECAYYMAKGGKEIFGSDISIAITGIAGPTGGTPEKPVGLVFIGINYLDKIYVVGNQFSGERKEIKMKSALKALYLLNSILDGVDFSENLIKL